MRRLTVVLVRRADLRALRPMATVLLVIGLLGMPSQPVRAAVISVPCNVTDLADAITVANGNGQADTVELTASCTYALSSQLTIHPDSGNPLTIVGNGATISGGGTVRVLEVKADATLNLHDVTVSDGGNSGFGGGAFVSGTLSVSNSTFIDNQGDSGGAIYIHFFGDATVADSTFSANLAGVGGGIWNGGILTIDNSIISGNTSAGSGGGMYSEGSRLIVNQSTLSNNTAVSGGGLSLAAGSATVSRTTFADNSVSGTLSSAGGGIRSGTTLTVLNSTFVGNSSTRFGGGISNVGTLTLTNSTVVSNTASTSAGAGLHNAGTVSVSNAIVAGNPSGGNCANTGTFVVLASMADDATCSGFTQSTLADLNLGVLSGSPAYFQLLEGSVAIDAGDDTVCPPTDQPGNPRPQGAACDIGSFESSFRGNEPPMADAGGPYKVDEGSTVELFGTGTGSDEDPLSYAWDLDGDGIFETPGQDVTFSAVGRDGPDSQIVVLQVCDDSSACGTNTATVDILNVAPTITEIAAPTDPVQVGTEIAVSGTFTDPGTPDTHTASWEWGDGTSSLGTVDQVTDIVSDVHSYADPGVYTLTLTVTDDDGGSDTAVFEFVVAYDPEGGFVTGGGWINSPEGAYTADPSLMGRAHFGFVSKYIKGATVPSGQTQFQFDWGELNFHSTEYQWLVIAGPKAQYKGSGTINGTGDYGFMLTVNDGQVEGGGGVDRFRIKIWNKATDEVVYDNQLGDAHTADAATELGGGSIVIHKR